jgi:RIO kinase 1
MFNHEEAMEALASFIDEGWISEVLFEVKSGKEATVYCCAGGDRFNDHTLLAAKIYRPIESRRFKNDAIYQTGRMHLAREGRAKRAAENKSAFGRKVQYATWLDNEWQTMNLLFDVGGDIPQPIARGERAILMRYCGDETQPAPKLSEVDLARDDVSNIADRLLWNVELMLHHDRVHGDLSPFNILYWLGEAIIIDFPQAIDPRLNSAALPLLTRDIANICDWARKRGVMRDTDKIIKRLWSRFVLGEIG